MLDQVLEVGTYGVSAGCLLAALYLQSITWCRRLLLFWLLIQPKKRANYWIQFASIEFICYKTRMIFLTWMAFLRLTPGRLFFVIFLYGSKAVTQDLSVGFREWNGGINNMKTTPLDTNILSSLQELANSYLCILAWKSIDVIQTGQFWKRTYHLNNQKIHLLWIIFGLFWNDVYNIV